MRPITRLGDHNLQAWIELAARAQSSTGRAAGLPDAGGLGRVTGVRPLERLAGSSLPRLERIQLSPLRSEGGCARAGIFSSASGRGIKTALPPVARVEMICITRISQVSVRPPPRRSESSDESETKRRRTPVAINQRHTVRTVGACELAEAWANIERLARGLDQERSAALREQLRAYLENRIGQSEWLAAVHAVRSH